MSDERKRLQFNPGPLKVVPDAQREVWTRSTVQTLRCFHEDGRGRCTSRDTKRYFLTRYGFDWLCEKHKPQEPA